MANKKLTPLIEKESSKYPSYNITPLVQQVAQTIGTNSATNRSGSGNAYSANLSVTNVAKKTATPNANTKTNKQTGADAMKEYQQEKTTYTPKPPADTGKDTGGGGTVYAGGSYAPVGSGFVASDTYNQALAYTQSLLDKLSSGRTSYTDKINGMLSAIENYGKFSYDMNKDPLFQNALASAMKSGQTAMQDTIGQASALTGGYANSYAVSAGNQAYNQMIGEAYDQLPDYYGIAKDAYEGELNNMYKQLGAYGDLDKTEYDRLANAYNAYSGYTNNLYDKEYNDFWNNKNFEEQQRQFSAEMGYKNAKLAQEQANWEKEYELSVKQAQNKATSSGKKDIKDIGSTLINSANKYGLGDDSQTMDVIAYYANQGYDMDEMVNYVKANMDKATYTLGNDGTFTDQWGVVNAETPTFSLTKKQNNEQNDEFQDQYGNTYTRAYLTSLGFKLK